MGKSFKSRIAKKLTSMRKLLCCCCIKTNKVAPMDLSSWMTDSSFRNVAAQADSDHCQRLQSSTTLAPEIHVCPSDLFRALISASDGDVDIERINLASSVSYIMRRRTRVINEYSVQPEDTPLPFYIQSPETGAIQGIVIRGSFAQDSLGPMFSNTQCTSMAYQALAYKTVCGQPHSWDYRDIDALLEQGHSLHTHFREVMKLSTNVDNRVAIHELPQSYEVPVVPLCITDPASVKNVKMTVLYDTYGVFAYDSEEIAASFKDVAAEFPVFLSQTFSADNSEDVNMILTIGDFSMAIWRQRNEDAIWLFDSHRRDAFGLLHVVAIFETNPVLDNGAALARSFDGVNRLLGHLTEIYGRNFYYNARFFSLVMDNSDSVQAIGNESDEEKDNKENSQEDISADISLDEEKDPP